MTLHFKSSLAWAGATVLGLVLPGWYLPAAGQSVSPAAESTQTLLMGTDADYIPFEYRDPSEGSDDGVIVGFDVDIANYIAEQLGVTLQIEEMPFDELLPVLETGELDFAIAGITPTPERQQVLDFSDAYLILRHALVSRRSNPIRTLADLPNQRVVVQQGSVQEQAILEYVDAGLPVEVTSLTRLKDIVNAVREGQADVAIVEELVAEAYLENNPTLEMDVLGEIASTPVAIAFPQGSPYVESFNQVLNDMKTSGELQRLAQQWFTAEP